MISRPRRRLPARPGAAICWGAVTGVIQAVSPLAFWWLEPRTVYALGLALIAAVYIGFAIADGRPKVIAVGKLSPVTTSVTAPLCSSNPTTLPFPGAGFPAAADSSKA